MRKLDNRGVTLIELLVAITILALVTVPLLHSFITATSTNTKAKRVLEATTAGENVFEELKAEDVSTFMEQATEASASTDAAVAVTATDSAVRLTTTVDREVNGKDYHMVVTLDPTGYMSGENAAESTDYNSLSYAQLENLSPSDNALLLMSSTDVDSAVNELLMIEPASGIPGRNDAENRSAAIRANLKRNITVKINNNAGYTVVTATVTYTDGSYSYQEMEEHEIYNNSLQTDNVLSNLFICFYPMYNNTGSVATETITIDNSGNYRPETGGKLKVYLVRQTGNDSEADAVTKSTYTVDVQVREGSTSQPCIELATNLKYGEASGNEMLLTYSGASIPQGSSVQEALKVTAGDTGLWHASSETRIYQVTIEVYRQKKDGEEYGTNDLLTTITGTKIDKKG
jgi:prepilin-type N-terminal cleavage/methylation domain-containing protein